MINRLLKRMGYVKADDVQAEQASDIGSQYAQLFQQGGIVSGFGDADMGMKVSALSACVRLISGNVAKLPFPVYRRTSDGEDRSRDRDHPLDVLLNRAPNRWQSAYEFRRMLTAHVALHGNGYALKRTVGSRIRALEPFADPERMTVEQDQPGDPPSYRYGTVQYRAEDILHLRDLTLDGLVGLSRIDQARQGIVLSYSAEMYATSHFLNGADPGVVIKVPGTLDDKKRNQLIESWRQSHGGPGRAHNPTVVEGGVEIERGAATYKDSQFLELRSFQVEDIARQYGVPPHLIGLTEKQTSYGTGVEQMALGFLEFHLLDWLVMWESAIDRDCLSEFESDVFTEHTVAGLLRADLKTRMESYAKAIQNGILSPDEARKKENLSPRADGMGDRYWRPANMVEAGEPSQGEPVEPAVMPGDRPRHAWRTKARAAQRKIAEARVGEVA